MPFFRPQPHGNPSLLLRAAGDDLGMSAMRMLAMGLVALLATMGGAQAERIKNPTAIFSGLDKITGKIISFDVAIDETVQFGALQVTPRVCYSRSATE